MTQKERIEKAVNLAYPDKIDKVDEIFKEFNEHLKNGKYSGKECYSWLYEKVKEHNKNNPLDEIPSNYPLFAERISIDDFIVL